MKKSSIIFLVFGLLFSACESFLEEDPSSQLVSEQFYQSEADAIAAINATYEPLNSGYVFDGAINYMNSVETDEAERGQFGGSDDDFYDAHEIATDDGTIEGYWKNNYIGIERANLIIKYVPDINNISEEIEIRIIGEAKFLRAVYYLNLVMAFGDVPLLSGPTENLTDIYIERSSVAEIFDQIEQDLTDAESSLNESSASDDVGRATSGAATALLSRVYLYQGDFNNARTKALQVINSKQYGLLADYGDLLLPEAKNGVEHIFSVQFDGVDVESSLGRLYGVNSIGSNPAIEIDYDVLGISSWQVEQDFYDYFPDTYRKRVTFLPEAIPQYGDDGLVADTFYIDPHTVKYRDPARDSEQEYCSNNFNVIRYGDVLLMFAEADNEINGPTEEGVEALNQIRQRARGVGLTGEDDPSVYPDINYTEVSQSELRDIILDERKWELCFEGLRRWDLLRTDRYLETFGSDVSSTNLLFPIPSRELIANPKLTQNSGYN